MSYVVIYLFRIGCTCYQLNMFLLHKLDYKDDFKVL